jgi:hypothetical protein
MDIPYSFLSIHTALVERNRRTNRTDEMCE